MLLKQVKLYHICQWKIQGELCIFYLPDCWLDISVYPEGPAVSHLHTDWI
jgi:hypothetical protein